MAKSEGYVSAQYLKEAAQILQKFKERTYELMELQSGQHILDAGCGPGVDTIPLADYVGPQGSVTGVDIDSEMLDKANQAADVAGHAQFVRHVEASVAELPFKDNSFHVIRAERLFQVLPNHIDPNVVMKEFVRVLQPGGRIVLADADWGTFSVNHSDAALERKLVAFFAGQMRPNGYAGRQLMENLIAQELKVTTLEGHALIQTDPEKTTVGAWLQKTALKAGMATQAEIDRWDGEIKTMQAEGRFYSSVNMVIAVGLKA